MTYVETEEEKKAAEAAQASAKAAFAARQAERGNEPPPLSEDEQRARRKENTEKRAPLIGQLAEHAMELMYRRAEGKSKPMSTPWPAVNSAMNGGLWPGLHVAIGATGDGKTQWVLQVALQAARAGTPVLYVGLELGGDELVPRILALMMGQDKEFHNKYGIWPPKWSDLYLGKDVRQLDAAVDYMVEFSALPIRLEVAPPYGWSSPMLTERALSLREMHPEPDGAGSLPLLIIIDYLQVIAPERENDRAMRQELRERIGQASYVGRAAARDLGAVVLMISSMSRHNASRLGGADSERPWEQNPRIFVDIGKESGEIEYAADSVMVLCRGEHQPEEHKTEMHLGITKLRAGIPSWQHLSFDGNRFESDEGFEKRPAPAKDGSRRGRPKGVHTKHKEYPHLTRNDSNDGE